MSNSPLRGVIDASLKNHKRVYIVDLFPKNQKKLPTNMFDTWHSGVKDILLQTEKEYHKLATHRGAIIEEITKIEREEDVHYIFEDADSSIATIQKLIQQGEEDAKMALQQKKKS